MSHTTEHNGRLANQIIRNFVVSLLAEKNDLFVTYASYDIITNKLGIPLHIGNKKYENEIIINEQNYKPYLYDNLYINSNINLNDAYMQTQDITNLLYEYLRKKSVKNNIIKHSPFKNRYENNNDMFIHIRLGDVINKNPGLDYYIYSVKYLFNKNKIDNIFIASDSPEHNIVQELLKYPLTCLINMNEVETIQFGSTCKYIILSNGTYSSTIGYLGFNTDEIIYPKVINIWHGDIYIDGWTEIDTSKIK